MNESKKKRERGRPRKNEIGCKQNIDIEPVISNKKRKRGRPRKSDENVLDFDEDEHQFSWRRTRSKRPKLDPAVIAPKFIVRAQVCCKICFVDCTNNAGLSNHIRARHGMNKLKDYYSMNQRAIKAKQNEMHYNDSNALIDISPTHRSRNIKYKYKCTVCQDIDKYCAGHVGISSHLRSHVKAGDILENEHKKLYKQIMKHPIPINVAQTNNNSDIQSTDDDDDDDEDEDLNQDTNINEKDNICPVKPEINSNINKDSGNNKQQEMNESVIPFNENTNDKIENEKLNK